MYTPSTRHPSFTHPNASLLRQRAGHLRELAASIERALVMVLADTNDTDSWDSARGRLCNRLLERNLHQLHQAADDLRTTALRFRRQADELDLAGRPRVA
jgi:hypothetical protein